MGMDRKNCNALNAKTLDPRHRVTVTVTGVHPPGVNNV